MHVLLLSMPDAFEHTPTIGMCMPNGALASLAGNIDPHHQVAIADLVLVPGDVAATVERLVREHRPDVVGLSCMTFQRRTALRLVRRLRAWCPQARLVAGGYDPSLATEAWTGDDGVDFVVRGEGETTFRELLRALEARLPRLRRARREPRRGPGRHRRTDVAGRHGSGGPQCRATRVASPRRDAGPAEPSRARPARVHLSRRSRRRGRDLARLHVRLQLLLDHRDARPELLHARDGPRGRGHRRCPRPRRPRHLPGGRQRHARRASLRGALRGDHRGRPAPPALHRAGHDVGLCRARRSPGAADEARGVRVRVPRDRERARRRPRVPEGVGQECPARGWAPRGQRDARGRRGAASSRHLHRGRPHRRQPRRHHRGHRGQPGVRPPARGLALHPASDAVSTHAHERGLPPTAT